VAALTDRVRGLGVEVDILVNNAGYGLYGPFLETSLDTELAMIQVNIVALTELTKRMLPGMVARKSGRILNLRQPPRPCRAADSCITRRKPTCCLPRRLPLSSKDRCHRDRVVLTPRRGFKRRAPRNRSLWPGERRRRGRV
jgi:hypothetical protein